MKKNQFNGMTAAELNDKVVELKKELFNLRFQLATGQLPGHDGDRQHQA